MDGVRHVTRTASLFRYGRGAPQDLVMRIGLFGGSFNPVHIAHLVQARDVLEQLSLDRVEFVVSAQPPHKLDRLDRLASAEQRLEMVRLAISGQEAFSVSRVEIDRPGPSYTIDTVRWYRRQYPDAELYWILGADNLLELHQWREAEALVRSCRMVVVERPGFERIAITPERVHLPDEICRAMQARRVAVRLLDINSTDIRRRLREGRAIEWLVPDAVATYIHANKLYG
ncbi:MAG: nicotinate-nucleotide adenylyltransferase [Verrucomicrobiota bacterium]